MPNSSPPVRASMSRPAKRGYEAPGDGDQQFVAGQRAHACVDPAEPVEIDHQHREARRGCPVSIIASTSLVERGAVGQAGQAVGHHLAAQAVLGLAARRSGRSTSPCSATVPRWLARRANIDPEVPAIDCRRRTARRSRNAIRSISRKRRNLGPSNRISGDSLATVPRPAKRNGRLTASNAKFRPCIVRPPRQARAEASRNMLESAGPKTHSSVTGASLGAGLETPDLELLDPIATRASLIWLRPAEAMIIPVTKQYVGTRT